MKTTTLPISNSINHSPLRCALILIPLILMCAELVPRAGAVTPPPDGGYPGSNTAEGDGALQSLTSGVNNTAIGFEALFSNTTGVHNTAIGFISLGANTAGFENTATGWGTLLENTIGFHNTATGFEALLFNTTGNHNTANGDIALLHNTTGNFNTANGAHSLVNNSIGSSNIALGFSAGENLTIGSNNIDIGNSGIPAESHTMRIGTPGTQIRTFIAGISGAAVTGTPVVVNAGGQLGMAASSARYKDRITPMEDASETIFALKPVTFQYKKEIDPEGVHQFGLVAEEVEKVNPDLVVHDKEGKPYSVRYDQVNAMLLNEFLKEHRTVQQLEQEIAALTATVKEQTTKIQKVSAWIDASKPGPRITLNNQ